VDGTIGVSSMCERLRGHYPAMPNMQVAAASSSSSSAATVSLGLAVEVLSAVGEALAEEDVDMARACKNARSAAAALERVDDVGRRRETLAKLLAAVSRVLALADACAAAQVLAAGSAAGRQEALNASVDALRHFAELAKAFGDFAADAVRLVHVDRADGNGLLFSPPLVLSSVGESRRRRFPREVNIQLRSKRITE